MTFEEWGEWQADLEDEYLQQQWEEMQEEDEPSPEDDPEYTTLEGTLDSETFESKSSPRYWHELPKWDDVALFPCDISCRMVVSCVGVGEMQPPKNIGVIFVISTRGLRRMWMGHRIKLEECLSSKRMEKQEEDEPSPDDPTS